MPHRRTSILGAACGVALALPLALAPQQALAGPVGAAKANLLPGADFSSGPTSIGPAHLDTDTDSHGTTMAVLIAGAGGGLGLMGLAPEAKILPVRMQKQTGEDPDKITAAVKWA